MIPSDPPEAIQAPDGSIITALTLPSGIESVLSRRPVTGDQIAISGPLPEQASQCTSDSVVSRVATSVAAWCTRPVSLNRSVPSRGSQIRMMPSSAAEASQVP
jgi:hypothetical protein